MSDVIATRSMITNPRKQQIPPLRCAPVGMTDYVCPRRSDRDDRFVDYFRDRTL